MLAPDTERWRMIRGPGRNRPDIYVTLIFLLFYFSTVSLSPV